MDDEIGNESFRFSHKTLEESGGAPIPFSRRWRNEGDWEITGHIKATVIPRRDSRCCEALKRRMGALEQELSAHGSRLQRLEKAGNAAREPATKGSVGRSRKSAG